jgi:tetratricopeptide (TPR) repeat protein
MVVKTACALALVGVCLIVSSRSPVGVEADAPDFDDVCSRARQHLREGRRDEAMTAMTAVEGAVRANVEREPGRELRILMIKARAYWHQMDTQGLEQFLTRFEKDYAETSAASWVQRAAWYERMLGYRFAEDLPQAVQALEKYKELEEHCAGSQDKTHTLDAAARDFDLHVRMPAEIGDLYRYMGRTDLALQKYRSALEYVTAHSETFRPLDENPEQLIDKSLSPSQYAAEILPTAIRECEAPQDSILGILGRDVTCEAQQADWLLSVGRACRQRLAIDSAQEHYHRAQQALEAHQARIDSLAPPDKARYLTLQEQISKSAAACHAELVRLDESGL